MHALEFNLEGIAMFATKQIHKSAVWHKKGQLVPDGAGVEALLQAAGLLDHKIVQSPLFADYDGSLEALLRMPLDEIQGMNRNQLVSMVAKAVKGSDLTRLGQLVNRENDRKHLSIMSEDYRPVQLMECLGVLDVLVEAGEIDLESAGSLRNGCSTFLSAKLTGDPLQIVDGDLMDRYITVLDSYDGFSRLHILATAILVVCLNTFRAAMADGKRSGKISSRTHRKGILGANHLDEIRVALGIVREQFEDYKDLGQSMALIKVSDREAMDFFETLLAGDKAGTDATDWHGKTRRAVMEVEWLYENGPGQELDGRAGTAWGLLNAVTAWTTHLKKHKRSWSEDRTGFSLLGAGHRVNERAHELLINQYQLAA